MMNAKIVYAGVAVAMLAAAGCMPNTKSGRGFHMPAGSAEGGKVAFVQLKCNECHRVNGVELPAPTETPKAFVYLGGDVTRVRTYGELVTAIVHPSREQSDLHVVPATPPPARLQMKDVNRDMTVAQLIDIVTFLEPTYQFSVPSYVGY
jgi:L-cysteine S-thiosulfotransferase